MRPDQQVVVVGGGPAGLAAATWLGRWRCRTAVLDSGEYRNRWVDRAHGYLGSDPVSPSELLGRARKDLEQYPSVELVECRATGARTVPDGARRFEVMTDRGPVVADRVVLANGTRDEFPDVDGFLEHYGADVFHCPLCDGYEAKGRTVVLLGWAAHVAVLARKLLRWAAGVTVVTDGRRFDGDAGDWEALRQEGIDVVEEDAVALVGRRGALRGVRLRTGALVDCDLMFFSLPNRPVNDLAADLGCRLDKHGYVVIDREGATSVEGVFAAGDVTPGRQLIQVAAAQGALAGLACAGSLSGDPAAKP